MCLLIKEKCWRHNKSESFWEHSSIAKTNSVAIRFFLTKVMNSILTHDLTNSPMEEMKQKSTNMMDRLVEEESIYLMDKLVEVPNLFFCILVLSFAFFAFLIIGFVLHICRKAESSSRRSVQEWVCNGTSRQHRWRALDTLHRECLHEELFQKPAAKMEAEADKKKVRSDKSVLVEPDKPYAICSYGTIKKLDHV